MGKEKKTIPTKFNSIAQHPHVLAISTVLIAILITSLFGCAPATPIVIPLPTTIPVVSLTATSTIQPTQQVQNLSPTQTPFSPKATIKIAVQAPLSGSGARQGNDVLRAAELAAQKLSRPLNEFGYQIEIVSYDDQSNVQVGVANAKKIVADPQILCGIGHLNSAVMIQASEIYHQYGLAFISPAATSATVTDRYYSEVNRVVGRDDGEGIAGARFAQSQGFSKVVVVHNSTSSNEKNADYFKREAAQIGINTIDIKVSSQTQSFAGVIRRILAENPDLVYFAGRVDQAGPFFRDARAAGYMGTFLGTDSLNRPDLVNLASPTLVEGGGMYYAETVAPAKYYAAAAGFVSDFNDSYGVTPQEYAAPGYDAAAICLKAIEEAAKAKEGQLPKRTDVTKAVRALKDYQGITGTINFNGKGDPMVGTYFIFKVISSDPTKWSQNAVVASYNIEPPR